MFEIPVLNIVFLFFFEIFSHCEFKPSNNYIIQAKTNIFIVINTHNFDAKYKALL